MAHDVSSAFTDAVEASVNDVSFDVLFGWDKSYDDSATFFELDVSTLDGPDFLQGGGDDVTFFDKYAYQTERDNVMSWEVSRQTSLYPFGMFQAQANITLDNTSKRYLPGFDPDIGGHIKNRRPVRIYAGFEGEIVQQFGGFTDIPKNTLVDRKTTMSASDVMDYFENHESELGYFQNEYWHDIVEALLLEQGFTADQFNIEESTQQPIGYMPITGMSLAEIFRKGCEAEMSTLFCDENGIIQHWNRFHYQNPGSAVKELNYDNSKDMEWKDTPIINHVKVLALPRAVAALQKVWQNDNSIEVPAGETVTVAINFKDDFGALPVTSAHTPVFITDQDDDNKSYYNTNEDSSGGGAVGSSNIDLISFNLVGDTAFIEFENTSGSTKMFITDLAIYGTPAKVTAPVEEEYKDQTSIDDNGINPGNNGKVIEITNDWIQNRGTAFGIAFTLVEEYKDGNQQVIVKPFADPSLMWGDVVDLTIEEVDEDPVFAIIVGTKLSSNLQNILQQEVLVDMRVIKEYFTLDVSELDGTHVLAA